MTIQNLKCCEVRSFEEAIMVLKIGEEERNYAQTSFHDRSSRSHTVFQVVSMFPHFIYYIFNYCSLNIKVILTKTNINLLPIIYYSFNDRLKVILLIEIGTNQPKPRETFEFYFEPNRPCRIRKSG